MPIYKAPVEDVTFLLNDVFQIDRYDNLPGFTDASADVREAILGEAAKLSEQVLQPLNRVGDLEGCVRHDDGRVTTPKGFKEAFKQVAEGGWLGLSAPSEYGGQGLPVTLSQVAGSTTASGTFAIKRLDFKIGDGDWKDTSMVADPVQIKFKLVLTGVGPL